MHVLRSQCRLARHPSLSNPLHISHKPPTSNLLPSPPHSRRVLVRIIERVLQQPHISGLHSSEHLYPHAQSQPTHLQNSTTSLEAPLDPKRDISSTYNFHLPLPQPHHARGRGRTHPPPLPNDPTLPRPPPSAGPSSPPPRLRPRMSTTATNLTPVLVSKP